MKFFLYGHNGSGNHGCEAIVRSTCKILNENNSNTFTLATNGKNEDLKYGLDEIVTLKNEKNVVSKFNLNYIKAYLTLKLFKNDEKIDSIIEDAAILSEELNSEKFIKLYNPLKLNFSYSLAFSNNNFKLACLSIPSGIKLT